MPVRRGAPRSPGLASMGSTSSSSETRGKPMSQVLNLGDAVGMHALLTPNDVGARDLSRSMTFRQWNERSCRLANALLGMGLAKGDRVAILAYNCLEWMEIYV